MTRQASADRVTDMLAFVDESGGRGFSRNLTPNRDHEFGLVCALLLPASREEEFRDAFRPGYERFVAAMPCGAKLHITDAFTPGNESWASVARSVRFQFYELVPRLGIRVVYVARRLRVDRETHELIENIFSLATAASQSSARTGEHPSQSRIEEWLVKGLSLKVDAFSADFQHRNVDLMFDTLDGKVARLYREAMETTRNIGRSSRVVKRRHPDPNARTTYRLDFNVDAPFPPHTRFLGELRIAGKTDPLVLAADIVANALYDHLRCLPPDAPLNSPTSICGWELRDSVYGAMENAFEDIM